MRPVLEAAAALPVCATEEEAIGEILGPALREDAWAPREPAGPEADTKTGERKELKFKDLTSEQQKDMTEAMICQLQEHFVSLQRILHELLSIRLLCSMFPYRN